MLRFDLVRLVLALFSSKSWKQIREMPWLNVIIALIPAVDVTLNGVAVVTDHKSTDVSNSPGYGRS